MGHFIRAWSSLSRNSRISTSQSHLRHHPVDEYLHSQLLFLGRRHLQADYACNANMEGRIHACIINPERTADLSRRVVVHISATSAVAVSLPTRPSDAQLWCPHLAQDPAVPQPQALPSDYRIRLVSFRPPAAPTNFQAAMGWEVLDDQEAAFPHREVPGELLEPRSICRMRMIPPPRRSCLTR